MGYIFWHNLDCSASTPKMVLRFASRCVTPLRARFAEVFRPRFGSAAKSGPHRSFASINAVSSQSLASALGQADVSLHARVAVLELLANNSFDSILMTDSTKGNITYCNNAFTKLTGYSQEDILGKSPKLLQGAATDQKTIDRLREALKTGGEYEGRAINYKKDGTPFIMYWRVVPVKVGGEVRAWVAIQREASHV